MSRRWLSIQVELIEGGGTTLWPRPGRIFAAAGAHTFAQLAAAIDDAFARWDRAHLHSFELPDGTLVTGPIEWDDPPENAVDGHRTKLSTLAAGAQFLYTFDLGDDWTHLCTVAPRRIDPLEQLGIVPDAPLPYWGWGAIPDQYGRRFDGDDGEHRLPPNPGYTDLPPLRPHWGPNRSQ
jgi:hypothetical protein